jgi:DNA-3-methyladenine glycosylase II
MIISQQLSARAAETIERRVLKLVPDLTAEGFIGVPDASLRGAGLSSAKIRYINQLAERVTDGRLNLYAFRQVPDEKVILALTEVPGIGRWTAEMFLIFGLRRPNVLSESDAGLRRASKLLYGEGVGLESLKPRWHPFCSVASWYLWRHLDEV